MIKDASENFLVFISKNFLRHFF